MNSKTNEFFDLFTTYFMCECISLILCVRVSICVWRYFCMCAHCHSPVKVILDLYHDLDKVSLLLVTTGYVRLVGSLALRESVLSTFYITIRTDTYRYILLCMELNAILFYSYFTVLKHGLWVIWERVGLIWA